MSVNYNFIELEEAKSSLQMVIGRETTKKIITILKKDENGESVGEYIDIRKAALAGADFSNVETMDDIIKIYKSYYLKEALGL